MKKELSYETKPAGLLQLISGLTKASKIPWTGLTKTPVFLAFDLALAL
jgi:hypothetical protein